MEELEGGEQNQPTGTGTHRISMGTESAAKVLASVVTRLEN